MDSLIYFLGKNKHAFGLYEDLYLRRWDKQGPSTSSCCDGKGSMKDCGCWVHQLVRLVVSEVCANLLIKEEPAPAARERTK
jgi:hypothetical protein